MKKYYALCATAAILAGVALTSSCKEKAAGTTEDAEQMILVEEIVENVDDSTSTSIIYEYDDMGHLLRKVTEPGSSNELVLAYTYDEAGRMLTSYEKYADGSIGMHHSYQYNEKGDTLLAVVESYYTEDREVTDKTTYEYDKNNKLIHKYEYHAYMPEGDFCPFSYMITRYDFDEAGRLCTTTSCDVAYDPYRSSLALSLSKELAASPADEYRQVIAQKATEKPVVRTFTYDSKGMLSETIEDETRTAYTYNEQGKLTCIHAVTQLEGNGTYEIRQSFEYDKAGRCIKEEYNSDGYGYTNQIEYNAQGDTTMFLNTEIPAQSIYNKELRSYYDNGKLRAIYRFRGETIEWGYENNIAVCERYNEEGLRTQRDVYMASTYEVTLDKKGNLEPEAEFKAFLKKFDYKLVTTTRYKYDKLAVKK